MTRRQVCVHYYRTLVVSPFGCTTPPLFPMAARRKVVPKARNYVFTWNNYSGLLTLDDFDGLATYLVYSEEMSSTGTPHLQGYVELNQNVPRSRLVLMVPMFYDRRRGTQREAIAYCKKKDSTWLAGPYEYGAPKHQGERSDLFEVKALIDANANDAKLWEEHFPQCVRYYKSFDKYRLVKAVLKPRQTFDSFEIFVGGTGLGKSHDARAKYPNAYWVTRPRSRSSGVWWDGYTGQDALIIDEFYGWIPFDTILRICDQYPHSLEVKGGTVPCMVTKVIITSNRHPYSWYNKDLKLPWESFERRVTACRYYFARAEHTECKNLEVLRLKMEDVSLNQ